MVIVLHVTDFMRFYDLASHIIPQILLGVIPDHRPGASLSMTKRQIRKTGAVMQVVRHLPCM